MNFHDRTINKNSFGNLILKNVKIIKTCLIFYLESLMKKNQGEIWKQGSISS